MFDVGIRVKDLREKQNITQRDLCDKLAIAQQVLSRIEVGKASPQVDTLDKLAKYFNVTLDYLVYGRGELPIKQNIHGNILPIVVDRQNNPVIKIMGDKALAGYLEKRTETTYWSDLPEIQLPDKKFREGTFVGVEIHGESMEMTFQGGDIIVCRFMESLRYVEFGKIYVIVFKEERPVVKRITRSDDEGKFLLVSDNEEYDSYEVTKEDILELWQYDTLVRRQPKTIKRRITLN